MSASACSASWCAGASSSTAWYSLTASRSLFFSRLLRARSRCLLMSCAMGNGAFLGSCGLAGEVRPRILPRHRHGARFFSRGSNLHYIPDAKLPSKRIQPSVLRSTTKDVDLEATFEGSSDGDFQPGSGLRAAADLRPRTRTRPRGQFLHLLAHGLQRQPAAHQACKSQENERNRQRQEREKRKTRRGRLLHLKHAQSQHAEKLIRPDVRRRVRQ